jgi:histidine triad (HIT) family protein
MNDAECIFCKIADGAIPADVVHKTDDVVAFRDNNAQAPTHVLIIPRKHISTINSLDESDAGIVGQLFIAARDIAKAEGIDDDGFRVTMNCNRAGGQSVFHLHLHLLGGRNFSWPPG